MGREAISFTVLSPWKFLPNKTRLNILAECRNYSKVFVLLDLMIFEERESLLSVMARCVICG